MVKTVRAVWGQYSGLAMEEIIEGINTGRSPLQVYAEKRGLNYGDVVVIKTIVENGRLVPRKGGLK